MIEDLVHVLLPFGTRHKVSGVQLMHAVSKWSNLVRLVPSFQTLVEASKMTQILVATVKHIHEKLGTLK